MGSGRGTRSRSTPPILDELAIKNLSHRYVIALDRDDREEWASLFSDDAGDMATGEVYCVAHHMYEDFHQNKRLPFDLSHNSLIQYEDDYARIDGRWVFTRRRVITEARYVDQIIPAQG